ncbi:MAG: hypothetical protein HOO86_08020 [Bacteroidales bacterium]|nr:hypothetical protein [Bacteroidales bacterium]
MRIISFLFLFFIGFAVFSQQKDWDLIDQKIAQIPPSAEKSIPALSKWINVEFLAKPERMRAIQRWIAMNLSYDFNSSIEELTKKENHEIVASAFRTRKSVCGGYAGLMDSLCKLVGIQSYVIDGYTIQDGKINPNPHAWVAAKIDEKWWIFDPTWSSGRLVNGRYEHDFDESYFMVPPQKMILSHIPFDPIWQFLEFPQYATNDKVFRTTSRYDFIDSIQLHQQLSNKLQITNEIRRINEFQATNQAIAKRLSFLYDNLDVELYNENIKLYNRAIKNYNEAVTNWDTYIDFRNKHLDDIQHVKKRMPDLNKILDQLDHCSNLLQQMKELTSDLANGVFDLSRAIKSMKSQIQEEKNLINNS